MRAVVRIYSPAIVILVFSLISATDGWGESTTVIGLMLLFFALVASVGELGRRYSQTNQRYGRE